MKNVSGEKTTVGEGSSQKGVKIIMLYYTMHNCPGCREFTPMLVELYREMNEDKKIFEVVGFVTDKKEDLFTEYYAEMPWPAIPHRDKRIRSV